MPRVATKFDNHENLGVFAQTLIESDSLTPEAVQVVASDKDSKKSGEVTATIYKLAENADNPLDAALALFGGSPADLAKFAIGAYNDDIREKAKTFIRNSVVGPEKVMAIAIKKIADAMHVDPEVVMAKVKDNPAYLEMFLNLAK